MTATFGEVSYSDDVFQGEGKKNTNSKDLFLRLDEGSNELRLVTAPFQYLVHKYKKDGDPGFGQKVGCSALHGSCQLCALGDKAKPRWFYGVISRKTGTYKVLDISFAVFSQIRKLARNTARWGDPTKYDIDIVVDKNGGATGYYSVQPISKEPLSASDQQIKDDADLDDLKRRCTPPTVEQMQRRIDKINGVVDPSASASAAGAKKGVATKAPVKTATKAATVSMSDDDELNDAFPAYDSSST
jgi:hypothetical protein